MWNSIAVIGLVTDIKKFPALVFVPMFQITNSIEWVASLKVACSCMYEYVCMYVQYRVQIQASGPWPILSLFSPKGNVVSSFMQMRYSADLKCWQLVTWRTGCRLPPGAARTAPTPCTTHSMSIRFESESKSNENERRRMHEMPHYTSTWIGCCHRLSCETEQTKVLVWRPASNTKQRRAPHSKSGHWPLIYYARIISPP